MPSITVQEAVVAMKAQLLNEAAAGDRLQQTFPSVCIDTRRLRPGQAFFALPGSNQDGHAFLSDAVRKGAAALVVQRPPESPPNNVLVFQVSDTVTALQRLAAWTRRRWSGRLIAVTGSMGKTTTRSFIARLLAQRFVVHETIGNYNNDIGVPLSILELDSRHERSVMELGMNHPGEIDRLGRLVQPQAVVLTNVAPVHLEFFPSLDSIAEAKGEILAHLPKDGTLYFNADDPRVGRLAGRFTGRKVSFGQSPSADLHIRQWSILDLQSMRLELTGFGRKLSVTVRLVGEHFAWNLAAAVAVALDEGLSSEEVEDALQAIQPLDHRGVIRNIDNVLLWDDSYNSSPAALTSVLRTLRALPESRRKIAVLGDMLELGTHAPALHEECGRTAAEVVDQLITVGPLARYLAKGALRQGLPPAAVRECSDWRDAADRLLPVLQPGDLVLVKGSRAVQLDRLIAAVEEARS